MKTYSVGRDLSCDIVVNDTTDVISRRHLLLNVTSSGKMTIIDQSSNGTYVNGIRVSPNVPVPVTRKDIISLAHVAKLDWNQVPKSNRWVSYVIYGAITVAVIIAVIFGVRYLNSDRGRNQDVVAPMPVDTTAINKQREAARIDSIKIKERQDSIKRKKEKERQDSIRKAEAAKKKKASEQEVEEKNKNGKDKKDDKSEQNKKRAIG